MMATNGQESAGQQLNQDAIPLECDSEIMKEEKLLLEVASNTTILVDIINCVQKANITVNEFKAEESAKASGHISIVVEAEKKSIDALIKELEKLEGVEHVSLGKAILPSSELQNSFEE